MLSALVLAGLVAAEGVARPVSFEELVSLALARDPERAMAVAERRGAEAAGQLARWTRWSPRANLTASFGLVPGARGDAFASPDTPRDLDDLGPFWRSRLELSMPVLAFGRLAEAQRAAEAAVAAREARLRARSGAVAELAARAYYGHLLARHSLSLLAEVRGRLEAHRSALEGGGDETDPLDLFRVRNYGFQIDRLETEARRGLEEATLGLRLLAGAPVLPAEEELAPLSMDGREEELSDQEALSGSDELREAELAARARQHLARSEREGLPALALEGRFEYGEAPGRAVQKNPFIYEPFNVRTLGAGLALRWDLNFKQSGARAARAQAEADLARARAEALAVRLRLDLGRARARLRAARADHETAARAVGTTASWLRLAEENQGLGTAQSRDVVDAYAAYMQARNEQHRAVHDLNVALVSWRALVGRGLPEQVQ